ncbi:MAG: ABC transporter ATP-binding protein [Candidatus Cloacimonetes bacterium]|nr:ABC transporter ATP-binding protein [Candidatus Cloacimonadota bacterium]
MKTMSNQIYRIKDFSFRYPFQQNGIRWNGEFSINEQDFILLRGNSGSGKSTLLYTLKGLIPEHINGILEGILEFRGHDIRSLSARDKMKSGLLFQNPVSQMIQRDVRQELAFGLENLNFISADIDHKINKVLSDFGMQELLYRPLIYLSGGEMQKVALLSILLTEPEIVLLDEPTAFLDPKSASELLNVLSKFLDERTAVIVEHNLSYLKSHLSRSIEIDKEGNFFELQLSEIDWEPELPALERSSGGKEVLHLDKLCYSYPGKEIFKDVDFSMNEGQIISITGENGIGKSTLLKLISGVIRDYSGSILLKGKEVRRYKRDELFSHIGLLFQNPENHFIFQTVEEEIGYQQEYLKSIGLTGHETQNPYTLSEGEKRRLSLAIVQSMNRQILLLDEPTFGQDLENKVKLIKMISEIRKSGKSILIVSHDLPFVQAISDEIYTLTKQGFSRFD